MSAHSINSQFKSYLLRRILADWSELPPDAKPKTFWIAEHEQVADMNSYPRSPVVACWYYDGNEYSPRPISSFLAFMNLASGFPHTTGSFEIGYGGFASISDTEDTVLYWQFGGLHGMGYHCSCREGEYTCMEAWRS